MNFRGTFDHTLDAKHRLTIPAKFRAALSGGVVLAASPELEEGSPRTIGIWTADAYDEYTTTTLAGMNPLSPRARTLSRFFFNSSFETELDSANRVMIPNPLLDYASIDRDVVVTGSGKLLEVWDRVAWAKDFQQIASSIPGIAADLGNTV